MTATRHRQVADLWDWLPSFRAVAEAEHMRVASQRLHVSPSALSRTVRLLEDEVGQPLFARIGRGIHLNDAGRTLLSAIRTAMRTVHDALSVVEDQHMHGPLLVSSPGTLMSIVAVTAANIVRDRHPDLVPHMDTCPMSTLGARLLQGELDVAFSGEPVVHDDLRTRALGSLTRGIYCGRGHPLYGATAVTPDQLANEPFVAPPPGATGRSREGWQDEWPRRVGAYVTSFAVGVEICEDGKMLAVLPDATVRDRRRAGALDRLPLDIIAPQRIYATARPMLERRGRADAMTDAVAEAIALHGGVVET